MYYAYIYTDPSKNNEPFYVGKGHRSRAYDHIREGAINKRFNNRLKGLKKRDVSPDVTLLNCSSENIAFELEIGLIKLLGRKDLGLGPLYNMTDGGEGVSNGRGNRFKTGDENPMHDPKIRNRVSASLKGRVFPHMVGNQYAIGNQSALGLKHTDEFKQCQSNRLKGNQHAKGKNWNLKRTTCSCGRSVSQNWFNKHRCD